jgi:hypothetical protein
MLPVQFLAKVSLDRMMDITSGKQVTWPERFQAPASISF